MSATNLFPFFKLCALRIANLTPGSRSFGTYRTLVRQYAEEFGIRTEIEVADDLMIDALVLLWKKSCVNLDKWSDESGWTKFSENTDVRTFVGCRDFRVTLTPEGRELLSQMESQITAAEPQPTKSREIGFHAPAH
jgi:hypothetical protein